MGAKQAWLEYVVGWEREKKKKKQSNIARFFTIESKNTLSESTLGSEKFNQFAT